MDVGGDEDNDVEEDESVDERFNSHRGKINSGLFR